MVDEGGGASRSTDPAGGTSSATDVSLREYLEAVLYERDRRYKEVQQERDKAEILRAANQAYRDEKANELREQISQERGRYVTQDALTSAVETLEATLKPVLEYVASQQGARSGALDQRALVAWLIAAALGLWAIFQAFG